jgi:quinol monooxygenase YgiN
MATITLITRIPVADGHVDAAIAAISANLTASHQEDGVVRMALLRERDDSNRLMVVEIFRSAEDLDQHMKTPHLAAVVKALGPLIAGEITSFRLRPLPMGDLRKGSLDEA